MRNTQVIEKFLNKDFGLGSSIASYENKLYSYSTCMAQWFGNTLLLNMTKYSITTLKHQNMLYSSVNKDRMLYTTIDNVPIGTDNLTYYYSKL